MRGVFAGLAAQLAQAISMGVAAGVSSAALPVMMGLCLLLAAAFFGTGLFWLLVLWLGWVGGAFFMGALWLLAGLLIGMAWRRRMQLRAMGVPPGAAGPVPPPPGAVPPVGPSRELIMAELALTAFREASKLGRTMRARKRKPRPRYEDDLYE